MKQRILNHVSMLVILSVILTFIAASIVMYSKFNTYIKESVRNEAEYVRAAMEELGEDYINVSFENLADSRITIMDADGNVLFDTMASADSMENHKDRPEVVKALSDGYGENVRFSETLSEQTFYYALRLESGDILRVARTTDSVFLHSYPALLFLEYL